MRPRASAAAPAWRPVRTLPAALFTGAKITHLGLLPQGQPERQERALRMVHQFNAEQFGSCTNIGECEAVCPKEIKLEVIARMNRDFPPPRVAALPSLAPPGGAAPGGAFSPPPGWAGGWGFCL